MNEQIRAAYALNLWTVSVAQIVDYNDVYVLEQEYNNIMNNLNLEHMPKDEALLDIIKKILEEITNLRMDEGDRQMLEKRYQHQLKNAVWSAIPSVGAIFATDNPLALGITLATQVGIGYMNYRRNKAEYKIGNEEARWEIQKHRMMHLHGLQNELFETAWRVADKYKFPDEYRLSANQIKQFNQALMENNPVKRYNKLDSMKHNFAAYPAFWYHIGSTANNLFRSKQFEGDTDSQWYYRSCAVECFAKYKELNQFNLLRHDVMTASWALEYLELLDLNHENNCADARELIEIAERHSGNELDVLELCAFAYLRIRDSKNAARLLHILVNNGYNEEVNAQILSGLYIKQMRSENVEEALEAKIFYRQLSHITKAEYILEIPPIEMDLSEWFPEWKRKETFDEFVDACTDETDAYGHHDHEEADETKQDDEHELHSDDENEIKSDYKSTTNSKRQEARKLMTKDQLSRCNFAIHGAAVAAGAFGIIPIPVMDAIPISAAQVKMVVDLGKIFDQTITDSAAKGLIGAAASTLIGRSLVKLVPVAGWIASAGVAAGVTEAIGWTIAVDFAKNSRAE